MAEPKNPSLIDSSADEFDFSGLPSAAASPPPEGEESQDRISDPKVCPTCDLPISRPPGARGRSPKYHPECRPSVLGRVSGLGTSTRSKSGDTKKIKEADDCIAMLKALMVKGAMAAMLIDKYDGFVIMTAIPGVCDNLHGVLVAHDGFRKDMLAMKSGGSIFGLIAAVLMALVPIAAHHGLIPRSKISEMLTNMPLVMFKIAKRMKEGEQAMADMMERVVNDSLKKPQPEGAASGNATSSDPYGNPLT